MWQLWDAVAKKSYCNIDLIIGDFIDSFNTLQHNSL